MAKHKAFCLLVSMIILLTGCWDSISVEDRGFIIGIGIDFAEKDLHVEKQPSFSVTNQLGIPAGVGQTGSGSGGEESPFLNITSTSDSLYRIDEELSAKSSKVPFYDHLEILFIAEDVVREKHLFSHLLDTYIRNASMRRGIKVAITKDDPQSILEFTTPENKLPALYVDDLLEKGSKQSGFLEPIVLGDIEEFHLNNNSYVLPMVERKEEIQNKAGAVFQGAENKMVGTLNVVELQGLALMQSRTPGNIISFPYKDETFAFEVVRIRNHLKVNPANIDQIKATINIELEGIIKESFSKEDFEKPGEIEAVQKAVSHKVKDIVKSSIHKGQKEFNADVFNVWRELEKKHYKTWEKVSDDWEKGENYFSNVVFDVNVDTEVYSMGTSNKTN